MVAEYLRVGDCVYRRSDTVVSVKEIWRAISRFRKKDVDWDVIAKKLNRRGARTPWQKKPWTRESASNFYRRHEKEYGTLTRKTK